MLIYKKAHHRKRRIRHVSQNYAHSLLQRECRMASGMCDSLLWRHNEHKASLITSLTIVYSTVYSDANHRKHHSPASLAFVRGIHRRPVNSPHKWPVTRKMFPFDDVIMLTVVDMKPSSNASRMRFLAKSQTAGRSWLDHTHIVSKQIEIALVSWLKYSFFFQLWWLYIFQHHNVFHWVNEFCWDKTLSYIRAMVTVQIAVVTEKEGVSRWQICRNCHQKLSFWKILPVMTNHQRYKIHVSAHCLANFITVTS